MVMFARLAAISALVLAAVAAPHDGSGSGVGTCASNTSAACCQTLVAVSRPTTHMNYYGYSLPGFLDWYNASHHTP